MQLALKLVWEHRASWLAVLILTTASTVALILAFHAGLAYELAVPEMGGSPKIDVIISFIATFLVVQSIAALCLETQARDLAVIKTCGASTKSLRRTLTAEVLIVTVFGFVLGTVLSLLFRDMYAYHSVFSMAELPIPPIGFHISEHINAFLTLLVAVVVGAWGTIKRVSRQNIVEALHGDTITSKKRPKALRMLFAALSMIAALGLFVLAMNIGHIIKAAIANGAPKEFLFSLSGIPMFASVLFALCCLIFLTAVAPNLYQAILSFITKRLPANSNPSLQVGFNLARFNAAKYSGSITPIIAFITVVIMVFTATDSSVKAVAIEAQKAGIDLTGMTATNYGAISFLIGPAVAIAIIGSLCTIMMSGRNRIYVNKLTGVLGADSKTRLFQALAEMLGYMLLTTVLTLIIMLLTGLIAMLGNSAMTGESLPFVVSWGWWLAALATAFVVISLPAFYASYQAKRLDSKAILETFGE